MPAAIVTIAGIYAITEAGRWMVKQDILPDEFGAIFGVYEPESIDLNDAGRTRGHQANKRSNVGPINVIYGEYDVGGTAVFLDTPSLSNETDPQLFMALVLGEGELEEIVSVKMDGKLWDDSDWNDKILVVERLGDDEQPWAGYYVPPTPFGGYTWNENHRLAGTAYLFIRFVWDSSIFQSGLPRIISHVKGQKCYDPDSGDTAWSQNPAHVIRDYLTNTRYGCGLSSTMINDQSFIDAADYCDETGDYDDGGTRKRYQCNGIVDVDKTPLQNIRRLLTCCRGMLVFSGGQYKLKIDKPESSVFSFTKDNVIGNWSISLRDKNRVCNRVKVRYFDADLDYQPNICIIDSPELRTNEDNGEVIEKEIELPFTSSQGMARQLATIYLNQSRQGLQVGLTATPDALKCEIGDVVDITHETPGWTGAGANKEFRVVGMRIKNSDEIEFNLTEYGGTASYSFDQILLYDPAPDSNIPGPYTINPPGQPQLSHYWLESNGGLTASLIVEWAPAPQTFVDFYELRYKYTLGPAWINVGRFSPSDLSAEIPGLIAGRNYVVQVRVTNTFGSVSGWVQSEIYQISDILGTPSDITGLTITNQGGNCVLSWDRVDPTNSAPDHDVYVAGRIRIRFTTMTANWNNGLETGYDIPGSATQAIVPQTETGSYMVKAVSSFGVESANAATVDSEWTEIEPTELIDTVNLHDVVSGSPYWDSGTFTQTEAYSAYLRLTESGSQVSFTSGNWVLNNSESLNAGAVTNCRVTIDVDGQSFNIDNTLISTRGLVSTWPNVGGSDTSNAAAYALVYVRGAATLGLLPFAEYRRIISYIDMPFRFYQFKIELATDSVDYNYRMWSAVAKVYNITTAGTTTEPGVY